MKSRFLICLALLFSLGMAICQAQPTAYFSYGTFSIPGRKPFIETYLTLVGSSLTSNKTGKQLQSSVSIHLSLLKDTAVVKAVKYNLKGPLYSDSLPAPNFLDNQRYSLENGTYTLRLSIQDQLKPSSPPLEFRETFTLQFDGRDLQSSSVQLLESFKKATQPGAITKSGYDLFPYTVNYFPETQNDLSFYVELYNADTILGKDKPFVFSYYLETADKLLKLDAYGAFKKQTAAKVNPLLGKLNIKTLGTGNYNLVIEVRDEKNRVQHQKKMFFQRLNRSVDIVALQQNAEKKTIAEYFGSCNNADTLKMFVECLWPIANGIDKERIINQAVKKDPELMKRFVIDFWQKRAADTANPLKMWGEYYKNVQQVMVLFKCGKQPGYYTERGRVYLQYGPPNQRSQQFAEQNTFPYEIWQYYRCTDQTNGQFFSNRKFVFVNKNIADDCHILVHSDMRGEIYNDRWRFELTRRNNQGISNPDQTHPGGTQFNQFDEIYSNPR